MRERRPQVRPLFDLISSLLELPREELAPGAFTRDGTLSPQLLVTLLLYMVADANRRGYCQLLDAFWDEARSYGLDLPTEAPVSGAAFCTARQKLPPEVIRTLVHRVADQFEQRFGRRMRWRKGRRVFAIDGTKMNLQRSDALTDEFGVPSGAYCPQILASTLFDLTSKVPHDVVVDPFATSEREQLVMLLDRLHPGDVLVLDRGYPSFEVLCILLDAGIDFVIRVPIASTFKAVDDLLYSGTDDCRITIDPPSNHSMRERGPIKVRALRIMMPKREPTVLLTSLPGADFTRTQIGNLYRRRWQIEEYYKLTKGDYLGQDQLHARLPDGVRQEIHAMALFVAVTRSLMAGSAEKHQIPYENVAPKSGVLAVAAYITRLLLECNPDNVIENADRLLDRIIWTRACVRPGRRHPRRSFKPARKWGPGGRRGG